jgi:hypothetical protein
MMFPRSVLDLVILSYYTDFWPSWAVLHARWCFFAAQASAASYKVRNHDDSPAALDTCSDAGLLIEPKVLGLPRLRRVLQIKIEFLQSKRNKLL